MLRKVILLCSLILLSCADNTVPPGRIKVKNDSQDRDFNVLEVRAGGSHYSLQPGEYALLPKGVSTISFVRQYKDYARRYQVQCPAGLKEGIVIKLIDVHVNRLAGGCQTVWGEKD